MCGGISPQEDQYLWPRDMPIGVANNVVLGEVCVKVSVVDIELTYE